MRVRELVLAFLVDQITKEEFREELESAKAMKMQGSPAFGFGKDLVFPENQLSL
jgi:hypothetical protein